ncbi:uncharacterized protein LOC134830344 [Culicoides brevitarsis]|uniref:uncharacterized protein LOC134830344 n=1 Tax=Culicoides brevitarsis TaxID=469753 RepID=UPI00307B37A0
MKRKVTLEDYGFETPKRMKSSCEISDLPREMLREIFKSLPASDRLNARMVSQFWMEMLNKYFPKDNAIEITGSMDFSPTGRLYKTFEARLNLTKAKRGFARLRIVRMPPGQKFIDLINFLKLIGDEIRQLEICSFSAPKSLKILFESLPILETLIVSHEELLIDLKFVPKLNSVKLCSQLTKLQKLTEIQKIASVKRFSTESLFIKQNINVLEPFLTPRMKILLDTMLVKDDPGTDSITLTSNFNYCGEAKLKANDVTEAIIHGQVLNIAPLREFSYLTDLELFISYEHGLVQFTSLHSTIKFFNVSNLKISGPYQLQKTLTNADKLFRMFPKCEILDVMVWKLTDEDFVAICQHMPKLKKLTFGKSKISVLTIFDLNHFSLKDLKFLEILAIETKPEILHSPQLSWPFLPDMKSVYFKGEGFRHLSEYFFTQMAQLSPKITELGILYANNFLPERNQSKFFPIIKSLKLKELDLPGEGGHVTFPRNTALIECVINHCKDLENFMIDDDNGFSLAQEIRLFRRLPTLETLMSGCMDTRSTCREMERCDFDDLKNYLAKNINEYKDMAGTINYLYNYEIPHAERLKMETDFDANCKDEHLKMSYIVLHDYLKMSHLDLCRAFYNFM